MQSFRHLCGIKCGLDGGQCRKTRLRGLHDREESRGNPVGFREWLVEDMNRVERRPVLRALVRKGRRSEEGKGDARADNGANHRVQVFLQPSPRRLADNLWGRSIPDEAEGTEESLPDLLHGHARHVDFRLQLSLGRGW